jgi:hypothetical protein
MKTGLILLLLAVLLAAACADTYSSRPRGGDSIVNLAGTCATCGATIKDDYFADSAFRAIGPGNY